MATLTLAISGSGGAGVISTGEMLLGSAARRGYYGMLRKTFSPQIRGGESAAILRLGNVPVDTFEGRIDVLVALDWQNFQRFADEVPVSADTLVIQNSGAGEPPEFLREHPRMLTVDANALAAAVDSSWINLVFLGLLGAALQFRPEDIEAAVHKRLGKFAPEVREAAGRALGQGITCDVPAELAAALAPLTGDAPAEAGDRLVATGNQMAALGALEAGVRFVAAYPITPASDLLEFIARHIEPLGGTLVQAEDELAAINMIVGAGFGGVPALTATSGPGLALMAEGMGLAVTSETPVVVVDVMRGGPSTGIPTKSEQSDFNLAAYGLHGDAPHVVVACNSIADCHYTTAWAVSLARKLQTLVIVLSDQFLGQSNQILPAPEPPQVDIAIERPDPASEFPYWRYQDTPGGVSPMAFPGDPGMMYTADGLEHRQDAVPSPAAGEHQRQLDKRLRKLGEFDFGPDWAELHGDPAGKPVVVCFGATTGSALEARAAHGGELCVLSLRLLAPLRAAALAETLAGAADILVVEQNHGAQFLHYLRGELPGLAWRSLARPGPRMITAADILAALEV